MTREELLDPYKRNERAIKYLQSKEAPATRGNIRTALALNVLVVLIIIISMAL
jgi:hypothetical protein